MTRTPLTAQRPRDWSLSLDFARDDNGRVAFEGSAS